MEKETENWFVYLLQSEYDDTYYVGMTKDVENRLKEHNQGKSKYTKRKISWILLYSEKVGNREEARNKEKYYKTSRGKKSLLRKFFVLFLAL